MAKIIIVVHGGAGPDSEFIRSHEEEYKRGVQQACDAGYKILERGGTALDAVQAAVMLLEDNELFNAGRGSALNEEGKVEMCASIMNGGDRSAGAISVVSNVKNPVALARAVMEKTEHVYIGGPGALKLADEFQLEKQPEEYFVTGHQVEVYEDEKAKEGEPDQHHGTVGAVACDMYGNIASATSTGGLELKAAGRVGDSSVIGAGTYADNRTCAVSCTGDGELILKEVLAHKISMTLKYCHRDITSVCNELLFDEIGANEGDVGIIAVTSAGDYTLVFNCDRMHRAWRSVDRAQGAAVYK